MELRMDLRRFAELIKLQPATALFREGKLSLCVAALRCDIPCVPFSDASHAVRRMPA